jgi:hypothetical protein
VAQITAVTPVARAVGVGRVIQGASVQAVTGNWDLQPHEEKQLRREIVADALKAIRSEAKA